MKHVFVYEALEAVLAAAAERPPGNEASPFCLWAFHSAA